MAISSNQLEAFFSNYPLISFDPQERIKKHNERGMLVRYIKSGYVNVRAKSHNGRDLSIVYLGPNQYKNLPVGYSTFLDKYYITAITRVELWRVPRKEYLAFINQHPSSEMDVIDNLFKLIDLYNKQIVWLKSGDSLIKVTAFLVNMAENFATKVKNSKTIKIAFPLTHQMIADYTGLTRETVSLHLGKMRRDGLIAGEDGYILILQLDKLIEKVGGII